MWRRWDPIGIVPFDGLWWACSIDAAATTVRTWPLASSLSEMSTPVYSDEHIIITPGLCKVNLDYWHPKTSRLPPARHQSACAHRGRHVCSLLNSFHLAGNEMEKSLAYWSAFPADTLHRRGGDRVSEGSLHMVLSLKQVQKSCTVKLPYWKAKVRTIILHNPTPCARLYWSWLSSAW